MLRYERVTLVRSEIGEQTMSVLNEVLDANKKYVESFTDEVMRGLLSKSLETAALGEDGFYDVGKGPGSTEAAYIDWLTIADRNKAVVEDVERIRRHPLVPKNIPIHGYVYEVETGKLLEVPGAKEAGAAK